MIRSIPFANSEQREQVPIGMYLWISRRGWM